MYLKINFNILNSIRVQFQKKTCKPIWKTIFHTARKVFIFIQSIEQSILFFQNKYHRKGIYNMTLLHHVEMFSQ